MNRLKTISVIGFGILVISLILWDSFYFIQDPTLGKLTRAEYARKLEDIKLTDYIIFHTHSNTFAQMMGTINIWRIPELFAQETQAKIIKSSIKKKLEKGFYWTKYSTTEKVYYSEDNSKYYIKTKQNKILKEWDKQITNIGG